LRAIYRTSHDPQTRNILCLDYAQVLQEECSGSTPQIITITPDVGSVPLASPTPIQTSQYDQNRPQRQKWNKNRQQNQQGRGGNQRGQYRKNRQQNQGQEGGGGSQPEKRIRRLMRQGKSQQALKVVNKLLKQDPGNGQLLFVKGRIFIKLNNRQKGARLIKRACNQGHQPACQLGQNFRKNRQGRQGQGRQGQGRQGQGRQGQGRQNQGGRY